jgi:hypothetical protein
MGGGGSMGAAEDHDQARLFQSGANDASGCGFSARLAAFIRRVPLAGDPKSRLPGLQVRAEAAAEFVSEQACFDEAYFEQAHFEQAYF